MERSIKPEDLKATLAESHLIDVRRQADRDASNEDLPGASWHDPDVFAAYRGNNES
jgi:hypothetical protein